MSDDRMSDITQWTDAELLAEIAACGVSQDFAGIDWIEIQIDRETWRELRRRTEKSRE